MLKINLKQVCLVFVAGLCINTINAQSDSAKKDSIPVKELEDVVVSATRTTRSLKDVPMPVSVISGKSIERMGALRLNEVLYEQTGIQVIQDHGSGVQIQGLSTDYVLILIDGEPIVGRTKGNLDLSRLVVGNIERIEIVKGPSSSLFGSEAMGGVINIITKKGKQEYTGSLRLRYRKYNTADITAEAGKQDKKFGWYLFANRLSSDGYFMKGVTNTVTKTMAPFTGYTFNGKTSYRFTDNLELNLGLRYYNEDQINSRTVVTNNLEQELGEKTNRKDFSITPTLYWTIAPGKKLQARHYITKFETRTLYNYKANGDVYDDSYFNQTFNRSEIQYDHTINDNNISTVGIGNVTEKVDATRYESTNKFNQWYLFGQHQWNSKNKKANIVAGFRYDKHNQYADRFSPKLAAGYNINSKLSIQASIAGGYKAPTFEQLLLNFTNPTVGYSVLGTNVAAAAIKKLQDNGEIQTILIDPSTIGAIKAERSLAYNFGFRYQPVKQVNINVNFFRNNISDLIDFNTIAIKTNMSNVFSYFNRNRVFTQGVEFGSNIKLPMNLELGLGYQYLDAKDADVWDKIKDGKMYYRDPETNLDHKVAKTAYGGLYNRSKHTGNVKLMYENNKYDFDITLRGIFRGKFGNGLDVNGNSILDDSREYVAGYSIWNMSVRKFFNRFSLEAGVNNLFSEHTQYDPTTPALNWYIGAAMQIQKRRLIINRQ